MPGSVITATCQYPVDRDIERNLTYTLLQMEIAQSRGADIVHFSECSLSGYASMDFSHIRDQDERLLQHALEQVREKARELNLWVIPGTHHFTKEQTRPYNSLFVINNHGEIQGRYDKRLLTDGDAGSDRNHYMPGSGPLTFRINGVNCGLLICHEWRYPEIYREYMRMNTELVFQSWYDGNLTTRDYRENGKELGGLIVGTVKGNAANNHLWISASNTSRRESCFPSCMIRPDGIIQDKLKRNVQGVLISQLDTEKEFPDPSAHLRHHVNQYLQH